MTSQEPPVSGLGRRVLGLIVTGNGGSPLGALGMEDDVALLPFAGRYRLIDFALATFINSGINDIYVCVPKRATGVRRYLEDLGPAATRPRFVLPVEQPNPARGRTRRLLDALAAARPLVRAHQAESIVVLFADQILLLDLRQVLDAHDDLGVDMLLAALPVPASEAAGRVVLTVDGAGRVRDVRRAPHTIGSDRDGFVRTWTGALTVRTRALSTVLTARSPDARRTMCDSLSLAPYDVVENRLPGARGHGAYCHEPASLEAYYDAQMLLCTSQPPVDLYNPAWPLAAAGTGLPPAKVVTDPCGRPGQALDALVSGGSVIRGGVVVKSVVGHNVRVDSGAEVEDSVLLDGCHIGPGARVRRAVVGPGAVIGADAEIGYAAKPAAPARVLRSGLTLVPPSPVPFGAAAS